MSYVSSTQATIYIDDVWVDDACLIEYSSNNSKEPIFGYNSSRWDDVAVGHSIVTGTLVIHYRYNGYLFKAIINKKSSDLRVAREKATDLSSKFSFVPSVESQVNALVESLDDNIMAKSILKGMIWREYTDGVNTNPANSELYKLLPPVDIYVHLSPDEKPSRDNIEVLKNVTFVSSGKRLDNTSAEFGGSPIRESYNFLARSIEPLH